MGSRTKSEGRQGRGRFSEEKLRKRLLEVFIWDFAASPDRNEAKGRRGCSAFADHDGVEADYKTLLRALGWPKR
jgi:hypothetical protein